MSEDEQFNSNCITPETEFIDKLQKQLEFFITKKVSTDPLWKHTEIILSGHQVGENGVNMGKIFLFAIFFVVFTFS